MQNLKILIVEDEFLISNDIQGLLTDWGYQVVGVVASGEEAIPIFIKEQPDMALVDIQLSGQLDGIDTVRQFNNIHRIPIIYLTAQADFKTVERAKATEPAAYLLKPFNERHLNISLELAMIHFNKTATPSKGIHSDQYSTEKEPVFAHEVKLSADVILKKGDVFFIKQNYRFVKLKMEDLMYIEADRNHSYLIMRRQKLIVRMSLADIVERLDWDFLVRIHRSFAINIQFVEEFDDTEVVVSGKAIPLTAAYKDDFLKKFNVI